MSDEVPDWRWKVLLSNLVGSGSESPTKLNHPMILDFLKTITMLGTALFAYTILHRRLTVHDCLGYNRTLREWVPILFLGAHRGFHLLGQF